MSCIVLGADNAGSLVTRILEPKVLTCENLGGEKQKPPVYYPSNIPDPEISSYCRSKGY